MLVKSRMLCAGGKGRGRKLFGGAPTIAPPTTEPANGGVTFAEQNLDNFAQTPNLFGVNRNTEFGKAFGGLSEAGQKEAFQGFQLQNPYRSQEGQNDFTTMSELNALHQSGQLQKNLDQYGYQGNADQFIREQSDAGQERLRRFSGQDNFPAAMPQEAIEGIRTRNASPMQINRYGGKFKIVKYFKKGGKLNNDAANQF